MRVARQVTVLLLAVPAVLAPGRPAAASPEAVPPPGQVATSPVSVVPVGTMPQEVAFPGVGAASLDVDSGAISIFDPATPGPAHVLPVGPRPFGLAARGERAWVTLPRSNELVSVDLTGAVPNTSTTIPGGPQRLVVNAAGTVAYVLAPYAGTLNVVDLATGAIISAIKVVPSWDVGSGLGDLGVDPSGRRAVISDVESNCLWVLDLRDGLVVGQLPMPHQVLAATFTADLGRAFVLQAGGARGTTEYLSEVDLEVGPVGLGGLPLGMLVGTTRLPALAAPTAITCDGAGTTGYLPVEDRGGSIVVIALPSGRLRSRIPMPDVPAGLALSPSGGTLLAAVPSANAVAVVDLSQPRPATAPVRSLRGTRAGTVAQLSWSPPRTGPVVGYRVRVGASGDWQATTSTSLTLTGLPRKAAVRVYVVAENGSSFSRAVRATLRRG